jgi:hypothetical protein
MSVREGCTAAEVSQIKKERKSDKVTFFVRILRALGERRIERSKLQDQVRTSQVGEEVDCGLIEHHDQRSII